MSILTDLHFPKIKMSRRQFNVTKKAMDNKIYCNPLKFKINCIAYINRQGITTTTLNIKHIGIIYLVLKIKPKLNIIHNYKKIAAIAPRHGKSFNKILNNNKTKCSTFQSRLKINDNET